MSLALQAQALARAGLEWVVDEQHAASPDDLHTGPEHRGEPAIERAEHAVSELQHTGKREIDAGWPVSARPETVTGAPPASSIAYVTG